ncbi:hypothetical protein C1646_773299 [Rhizophagus diaphanus]|nr:hypothetical protein C1646_773299 [Rhizophagus diaphanus] [Rhizophagus sp. MUCL 43196]
MNINLSLNSLKKFRRQLHLSRRQNYPDEKLVQIILYETQHSNKYYGIRAMQHRLKVAYQIFTSRQKVRQILHEIDSEAMKLRRQKKLKRRTIMHVQGPNFVWSTDGYNKFRHWGFYIHEYAIKELKGIIPRVTRADLGVEYTLMAPVQMLFRENHNDVRAGSLSLRYDSSTSNQRIEAWWSFLRKYKSQFWIELFTEIEAAGEWNYFDYIDRLRMSYMPLLIQELSEFRLEWNTHRIGYDAKSRCPSGCPDDNFFLPELNHTQNFGFSVNIEDCTYIYEKFCDDPGEYITVQRKSELDGIVKNILYNKIDITNARQVYYILRTYLHELSV